MSIKEDRSVDPCPDYRAVVAVDFGTTYSGFAYTHLNNSSLEAKVYDSYPGQNMAPKTNTVLQYKNGFTIVDRWGYHALAKEPRRKRSTATTLEEHPVELFKLHLSTDPRAIEKAILPPGLPYRKAITDYLMQLQKLVKETLASKWAEISFSQVKFVFSVPAEWEPHTKGVLRECIHAAGFLSRRFAENLEFIAEPEAAAIFCLDIVAEHQIEVGDSFMVCDCGGGTVDLTTRTLLVGDQLGEITERTGGLCGGTYVDQQFEIFLARLVGEDAMVKFKTKHYGQYQHMILNFFCRQIKFHFCGDPSKFSPIEFDIELSCPELKSYMSETVVKEMDAQDWLIEISFENIKSMFDPVVGMILGLVQNQLTAAAKPVKAIFIVGGFGENPYLLAEMKRVFSDKVSTIAVPVNAQAAIMKGALKYGVNQKVIFNRRLTYTYGVEISPKWKTGDPEDRKTEDGRIHKFDRLATRGVSASISDEFGSTYYPVYPWQKNILFRVFATKENSGRYTDEPGMMLIGKLHIELPDIEHGLDRPVKFGLRFAEEEIKVSAVNTMNGKKYEATFKYDF